MHIQNGNLVQISYRLTSDDGELLDSSEDLGPLSYIQGQHDIIAGLEKALLGAAAGDELRVRLSPEASYGEVHQELIQLVPLSVFEAPESIVLGMELEASLQNGQVRRVKVIELNGEQATVDGNHPFAGQWLNFDIKILSVSDEAAIKTDA